jgi:hypothetical protein
VGKCSVDCCEFTNVSEVCTASIIRAIRRECRPLERYYTGPHGATNQKSAFFIVTTVRTSSHSEINLGEIVCQVLHRIRLA